MGQEIDSIQLYNDWGDYVSEDNEYGITDLTEGIDEYAVRTDYPGLPCYPVTIGELIQGSGKSYRIEHKLGHGAFSTTWLALEVETNTSVALKIHRTLTTAGQTESRTHQDIRRLIPDHSDCHLVISTSMFSLPGQFLEYPHVVIVLPVMGPDLHIYMGSWGQLSDSFTRLSLAKDVLKAIVSLHAHELIHCGM